MDPLAKLVCPVSKVAFTIPAWLMSNIVFAHGCFEVGMVVNFLHDSGVNPQHSGCMNSRCAQESLSKNPRVQRRG